MDNGVLNERDNPKALLVPGTVPLPIHNLVNIDSSDSEDNLPSTIDFDALKVPGLPETSFQNVMSWRGGTPRVKVKQSSLANDSPRKDTKLGYLFDTIASSVSDVSKSPHESATVSEDSESDSDSSTESDSSSSSGSSASSGSDSSSGTDSSDKKFKSRISLSKTGKDTHSVSNSSCSSRKHKNKRFTTTNYEPGSLKLRLSAFDQNQRGAKSVLKEAETTAQAQATTVPVPGSGPAVATKESAPPSALAPSKWKTARLSNGTITSIIPSITINGGSEDLVESQLTLSDASIGTDLPKVNVWSKSNDLRDTKRITRQSQSSSPTPAPSNSTSSLVTSVASSVPALAINTASLISAPAPQNGLVIFKGDECMNLSKKYLPVGETSQLTDSVTMTRVTAPRHSSIPSSLTLTSPKGQGQRPSGRSPQHLTDPVRYLAEKKSDLTISPIMSPDLSKSCWNLTGKRTKTVPFTTLATSLTNGNNRRSLPTISNCQNDGFWKKDNRFRRSDESLSIAIAEQLAAKFGTTEVKLKLPPRLDVSIQPIVKNEKNDSDQPKIVNNLKIDSIESSKHRNGKPPDQTLTPGRRQPVKKPEHAKIKRSKSNGKVPTRNRSKLSVFLPAAFKVNGKTMTSPEGVNGVKMSRTRVKARPVIGSYTNAVKGQSQPQPYEGVKLALTIAEKKKLHLEAGLNGSQLPSAKKPQVPASLNGTVSASIPASSVPPPPMRTKGAKKYIPEIVPVPVPEPMEVKEKKRNKRLVKMSPKKKIKRSRSEDKTAGEERGRKRHKRTTLGSQSLNFLCEVTRKLSIGRSLPVLRRRGVRKKSLSASPETFADSPGFTFERRVFKNFVPPFPMHSLSPSPTRRESSPTKSSIARGLSPGNRRKRGSILSKTRNNSNLDLYENVSADLQKLPLKKRHGHGNQHYDGPSEETEEIIHIFGATSLPSFRIPPISKSTHSCFQPRNQILTAFSDLRKENAGNTESALLTSPIFSTLTKTSPRRGRPRRSEVLITEAPGKAIPMLDTISTPEPKRSSRHRRTTTSMEEDVVNVVVRETRRRSSKVNVLEHVEPEVKLANMSTISNAAEIQSVKKDTISKAKKFGSEGTEVKESKSRSSKVGATDTHVKVKLPKFRSKSIAKPTNELDSKENVKESGPITSPKRGRGRPKGSGAKGGASVEAGGSMELEPPPGILLVRDKHSSPALANWNEDLIGDNAIVIDSDCPLEFINLPDMNGNLATLSPRPQPSEAPPLIPLPSTSPGGGKKRRKMNRTGFPVKKKKKKLLSVPAPELLNPNKLGVESSHPDPHSHGQRSATLQLNEIQIVSEEEVEDADESERLPWTSSAFSSTLTDRVKMRRRNSQESISNEERAEIGAGVIEIPGVVPSFMDVPNPPIIMPHKNNYLQAGLLSNQYKINSEPKAIDESLKESLKVDELEALYGKPLTKENLCPMPADTGFRPVIPEEGFQLPFDIWCLGVIRSRIAFEDWSQAENERRADDRGKTGVRSGRENKKPASKSVVPGVIAGGVKRKRIPTPPMPEHPPDSWTFKKLRTNAYSNNKPSSSQLQENDQLCECTDGEFKCSSDDCLNRVVFTECPVNCGEKCMNRRIQKHEWAPKLNRFMTKDKGYGVRSSIGIKKGDFILEYVGEVVTAAEFKERMTQIYVNDTHHYCLQLDSGLVIDGHRSGGEGRFVNHSCEPNCHMQKWSVNGLSRMALFALRDIQPDEELSYDYNFSLYNETEGQPCYCGSTNCRGVIGGKFKISASRRKTLGRLKGLAEGSSILFRRSDFNSLNNTKSKVLSRKEIKVARGANIFLIRNYEKTRVLLAGTSDTDERINERVEKLMSGWVSRYRIGSKTNKPIVLSDEEPRVARVARLAQIFFELYKHITTVKDTSGKFLCELFMELPMKRSFPSFHTVYEKSKVTGLKSIEKNILRGNYKTLQSLEDDIRIVLTTFAQAYKTEKPEAGGLVDRIKKIYKDAKQKAVLALEPFIVTASPERPLTQNNSGTSPSKFPFQLPSFLPPDPADSMDQVRCICGTFSEEGTMIQCEKCLVWQHCDCVGAVSDHPTPTRPNGSKNSGKRGRGAPKKLKLDIATDFDLSARLDSDSDGLRQTPENQVQFDLGTIGIDDELAIVTEVTEEEFGQMDTQVIGVEMPKVVIKSSAEETTYYCDQCDPREMDLEVKLKGQQQGHDPGKTYYLTLKREDGLLVKKNDTVYVLREWPPEKRILPDGTPRPHMTYKSAGPLVKEECDIFRIESLWKDDKGNRMVHGYNYLRPHETHHEPSRRFFPNEILRAPIHEIINIELIHGPCWVLDVPTYCKGRPIGCVEEHLYICDLRVNKQANSFGKIGKRTQAVCTKSFAFQHFSTKIKINRNVHPHGPPSPDFKMRPSIQVAGSSNAGSEKGKGRGKGPENKYKAKGILTVYEQNQIARKRWRQREKLHTAVTGITQKIENFNVDPVDLSFLLQIEKKSRKSKIEASASTTLSR